MNQYTGWPVWSYKSSFMSCYYNFKKSYYIIFYYKRYCCFMDGYTCKAFPNVFVAVHEKGCSNMSWNSRESSAPIASNPTLPPFHCPHIHPCRIFAKACTWSRVRGRIILVIQILGIIIFSVFANEKQKWPVSKQSSQLLIRLMYWLTPFPSWIGGESNSIWQNLIPFADIFINLTDKKTISQ